MSIADYCFIANVIFGLAAVVLGLRSTRERDAARAQRDRVVNWARHNLRAIRCKVDYLSPEAVSVCNSLETSLPELARADLDGLERHLITLRRKHNAALLDGAGKSTVATAMFLDGYEAGRDATVRALHQNGKITAPTVRSAGLTQSLGDRLDRALAEKGTR